MPADGYHLTLPEKKRQPGQPRGLSGAEKRRKRKGGNPEGGPGKKGAGMRPSTPRHKRGYLVAR